MQLQYNFNALKWLTFNKSRLTFVLLWSTILSKAVGQGDQTTQRVRVLVLTRREKPHRDQVSR
jgi:hypothetical protein